MAMYRKATAQDSGQLTALWKAVFGDDERTIVHCLGLFAGRGNVFVAEQNGEVLAQLLAVPCRAGRWEGVYFYALATRPESRGQGVMAGLMAHAEAEAKARGAAFAALIPASGSLFGFYGRHGYGTVQMRLVQRPVQAAAQQGVSFAKPAPEEFLSLRERFFAKAYPDVLPVAFSEARTALVLEDLWAEGFALAQSGEGYAVFCGGRAPFVAELAANRAGAEKLLSAIACETGAQSLKLALPEGGLYPGEGVFFNEAQAKWLDGSSHSLYLRFALDELPKRMREKGLL